MAGPQGESFFLDTTGNGNWVPGPVRDYVPSVMYDSGKVLFIGGGLDKITVGPGLGTKLPTQPGRDDRPERGRSTLAADVADAFSAPATQRDDPTGRHCPGQREAVRERPGMRIGGPSITSMGGYRSPKLSYGTR
jgi:hypothetical protein